MKKMIFICLLFIFSTFLLGAGWDSGGNWADPYLNVVGTRLNLYTYENDTLADDASFNLPASSDGLGLVKAASQDTLFTVGIDGTVVISGNTTLVAATDTDNNLCVFDGGDGYATVKNRLGAAQKVKVIYYYK